MYLPPIQTKVFRVDAFGVGRVLPDEAPGQEPHRQRCGKEGSKQQWGSEHRMNELNIAPVLNITLLTLKIL